MQQQYQPQKKQGNASNNTGHSYGPPPNRFQQPARPAHNQQPTHNHQPVYTQQPTHSQQPTRFPPSRKQEDEITATEAKIHNDLTKERPQWPFSSYSPVDPISPNLKEVLIGDISPEEIGLQFHSERRPESIQNTKGFLQQIEREIQKRIALVLADVRQAALTIQSKALFHVAPWMEVAQQPQQDHTQIEKKEFEQEAFTYGNIPETPPE
ncbi:MAG: uncharacterized protein A8A55_1030 [Amphiamblys sp. WSBS2006]|nr:MAG: uncharacterized protein A8A55_1030 [Amphiamblys sp. WSBS2006]